MDGENLDWRNVCEKEEWSQLDRMKQESDPDEYLIEVRVLDVVLFDCVEFLEVNVGDKVARKWVDADEKTPNEYLRVEFAYARADRGQPVADVTMGLIG